MISIVTCCYNTQPIIKRCIEAVKKHTSDYEHILVYNHPACPDVLPYLQSLDGVRIVDPGKNLGCAEGYNYGFGFARGKHLVKLDDDVEVTSGWAEQAVLALKTYPLAYVSLEVRDVGGNVLIPESSLPVQNYGQLRISVANDAVPFPCLVMPRSVRERLGDFSGREFYGGAEHPYFLKAKQAGLNVAYVRSAYCIHWGRTAECDPLYGEWKLQYGSQKTELSFENWRKVSVGKAVNLACGDFYYEGWINVDLDEKVRADIYADVTKLPFEDRSVDLVYAGHILEHFLPKEVPGLVKEWVRVLKPGGKIIIVVPDMRVIAQDYVEGRINCKELSLERLYSEERSLRMHKACYDESYLREVLEQCGLDNLQKIDIASCPYLVSRVPWQVGFEYVKE